MSAASEEPSAQRPLIEAALAQVRDLRARAAEPLPQVPGYRVHRELHRGGQGAVYFAVHEATAREVAIKVLHDVWRSPRGRARFEREVEVLARLRHRNLVTVHDCGVCDGRPFYVMDYVRGRDLDDELAARPRTRRQLVELLAQVCQAVGAAHTRGVLHRDLKPSNVRIDEDGEVRLLDFGLSKWLADGETVTTSGDFVGSVPWASPEQVDGQPLDARSDVYALGVVLYQALAGAFPYPVDGPPARTFVAIRSEPPRPQRHELGAELDTILRKALAKEPERRYQSALDLERDLRLWLEGRPIEARRDSATYVLRKLLVRHWPAALAALLVALALLTAAILVVDSRARWRDAAERLQARRHADRLQSAADALADGDAAAAEALLGEVPAAASETPTPPPEGGWVDRCLRAALARRRWTFAPGDDTVLAAAWAPDGKSVAAGGWNGGVWVLEADDGALRWRDRARLTEARAVAFSPDGACVCALANDEVVFFDARTGQAVRTLRSPLPGLELLSVATSRILAATPAGDVVTLDPTGLQPATVLHTSTRGGEGDRDLSNVAWTAVHADTARAATLDSGSLRLWDTDTGELRRTWPLDTAGGSSPGACALAFSLDGRVLALGRHGGAAAPATLLVFDTVHGARRAAVENLDAPPTTIAPTGGDACWTATWSEPDVGLARRIELASGRTLDVLPGRGRSAHALVPFASSQRLLVVTGGLDCWVDTETVGPVMVERPLALALTARGPCFAAADAHGGVVLRAGSGDPGVRLAQAPADIAHTALGADARVAVAGRDGTLWLGTLDGDELWRRPLDGTVVGLACDGADAVLVATADGAVTRVRGIVDPEVVAHHDVRPTALATGSGSVFTGSDGAVCGRQSDGTSWRIGLPRETPTALAFLASENLLAVGTRAGRVWLIDVTRALPLCALPASAAVRALAWDQERGDLLALGDDGRVTRHRGGR
ncbi:MAG: protein kinase [Planctomycetota bacterium]